MRPAPETSNGRTLGQLFKDLRDQSQYLLRRELDLFKAEVSEKAQHAGRHGVIIAVGAGVGLIGAFMIFQALGAAVAVLLALALDVAIAAWLGPLIVGLVLAVVAGVLIVGGVRRLQAQRWDVEHTQQSVEETKQWMQDKVSSH